MPSSLVTQDCAVSPSSKLSHPAMPKRPSRATSAPMMNPMIALMDTSLMKRVYDSEWDRPDSAGSHPHPGIDDLFDLEIETDIERRRRMGQRSRRNEIDAGFSNASDGL